MYDFDRRKKQLDVHRIVRRIVDLTSPNLPPDGGEHRWEDRSNRTIPVLLAPFEEGCPVLRDVVCALTRNLCSQGAAFVLSQPFRAERVVVGFALESRPRFLLGEVRQNASLGGGFWQVGVELTELTDPLQRPALESLLPLMRWLEPRTSHEALPAAAALREG